MVLLEEFRLSFPSAYSDRPLRGGEKYLYILDGKMISEDFSGNKYDLQVGDVSYVAPGVGLSLCESPERGKGVARGIQIMMDCYREDKAAQPEHVLLKCDKIPQYYKKLGPKCSLSVKVVSGLAFGLQSPLNTLNQTLLLDVLVELNENQDHRVDLEVPDQHKCVLYVISGCLSVKGGLEVEAGSVAYLSSLRNQTLVSVEVKTVRGCRFILVAAKPHHQRIFQRGGFIMNSLEDMNKGMNDYRKKINGFERAAKWKSNYALTCTKDIELDTKFTPKVPHWTHREISHYKAGAESGRKDGFTQISPHGEIPKATGSDIKAYDEMKTHRFNSTHSPSIKDNIKDL
jgi:redox-sensitive bicupin YhaK (pirin superfamily)